MTARVPSRRPVRYRTPSAGSGPPTAGLAVVRAPFAATPTAGLAVVRAPAPRGLATTAGLSLTGRARARTASGAAS